MKGQGLSITTIVVAAIALLILVVLVAVFTGQFGKFSQGVSSCDSRGGTIETVNSQNNAVTVCKNLNKAVMPGVTVAEGKTCCVDLK